MSEPSRQILVVDGDAPIRREIKSACEQDGYQVLEADTGSEALRVHTAAHPNLVLLGQPRARADEVAPLRPDLACDHDEHALG